MKFSIGSQFSREFSFEESSITLKLSEELNSYFKDKEYGKRIEKIYIGVICVSKDFEPFYKARPLKLYKTEPSLEFELKLDFNIFKESDEESRKRLLVKEILKSTEEVLMSKTINNFQKVEFIKDLKEYFHQKKYFENINS